MLMSELFKFSLLFTLSQLIHGTKLKFDQVFLYSINKIEFHLNGMHRVQTRIQKKKMYQQKESETREN